MDRNRETEEQKANSVTEDKNKTASEKHESEELLNRKCWMGIVMIIAGMYFCATGLSGALMPLRQSGTEAIDGMVIFTGIIGILGLLIIIAGSVVFLKYRQGQ